MTIPVDLPIDRGFRVETRSEGWAVEAWAPERASCFAEAMCALVATFASVPEVVAFDTLAVSAGPGNDRDTLTVLLEEVLNVADVFGLIVVRAHLADTEDGGVAGDMEVVPAEEVALTGTAPTGLSHGTAEIRRRADSWQCQVLALR